MRLSELFPRKTAKRRVDFDNLPRHIGIIMDGNGRWAQKRAMPRSYGHAEGARTFEKIVEFAGNIGIKIVTVYAFSTENWKRPEEEIDALMVLLADYLDNGIERLARRDVKIRMLGDITAFSKEFRDKIIQIEKATENNSGLLLNVALNYGGRAELADAVRRIAEKAAAGELSPGDIDEEMISDNLYTKGLPEPDMIIRPSGEFRLSNFLTWQGAYSELWFSDILWPDFTTDDFLTAISDYQRRSRRFGGLDKNAPRG